MRSYESDAEIRMDRLVEGELTDEERRRMLESFDPEPDGWKRCARAFLEAQSWRAAMQEAPTLPLALSADGPHRSGGLHRHWFMVAAALLLAFSMGFAVGQPGRSGTLAVKAPEAKVTLQTMPESADAEV